MKTFKDLEFNQHPNHPDHPHFSKQAVLNFENGYGVSVITGNGSYTNNERAYEMVVLYEGGITYHSGITEDVLGFLTEDDVTEYMIKVQELKNQTINKMEIKMKKQNEREYLYRGISEKTGDWVFGSLINTIAGNKVIAFRKGLEMVYSDVIDGTICEFTGEEDDYSTKIFEGDKVELNIKSSIGLEVVKYASVVKFIKGSFVLCHNIDGEERSVSFSGLHSNVRLEVIGSIHDECKRDVFEKC